MQLRAKYAHLLKTRPASAESGPAVTGAGSAAAAGEAPEAAPLPAAKPLQPADSALPFESAPAAPLSATAGAASGGTVGVVEAWRKRKEHGASAARVVRARRAPQKPADAPPAPAGAFCESTNACNTECTTRMSCHMYAFLFMTPQECTTAMRLWLRRLRPGRRVLHARRGGAVAQTH